MQEEWRPIPGFEELYEASTTGLIRSRPRRGTRGRVLRPRANVRDRYLEVNLCVGGVAGLKRVHRLIATTFFGPRPAGMEIRHLDGDRNNNAVTNLAYGTHAENMRDVARHGTSANARKMHCPQGHEYTTENTRRYDSGRVCLTCNRARGRKAS